MRIECDNCSAQYNIADEKVAGKMLKVRCKKCGNMIPVDGRGVGQASAAPAEEATRIVDVGSGSSLPEWFIVVEGDQQGPFTSVDLQRRFESGQLAADTFVWKDGMADWDALSAIPEFAPWTAPPEDDYGDESTRVVASHDEMPAPASVGQVASFPTGALSSIAPPESSKGAFAGAAAAETGRDAFFSTQRQSAVGSEPEASGSSLVGARNESSVLFSLDSLASSRSTRKEDVPRTEESGLINLQGLIDTRKATSADEEVGVGAAPAGGGAPSGEARKPVPMPTAAIPALPPQKKSNALVLVAIAALVVIVLLGGVIIWLLLQPATPDPQPVAVQEPAAESAALAAAEEPEPEAEPEPEPEPVAVEAELEGEGEGDGEGEEEVADAEPADEAAAAAARPSPTRQPAAERQAAPTPAPSAPAETRTAPSSVAVSPPSRPSPTPTREPEPAARPSQPAAPSGGGASDERVASVLESIRGGGESARPAAPQQAAQPALPQTLQRDDVQATIRRYQARVARCRSEGGDAQRYLANFVIQPSGSVTNVSVDPSDDVGTCLAGVVRDFQFPRFGGDPMPVQYPFRL